MVHIHIHIQQKCVRYEENIEYILREVFFCVPQSYETLFISNKRILFSDEKQIKCSCCSGSSIHMHINIQKNSVFFVCATNSL